MSLPLTSFPHPAHRTGHADLPIRLWNKTSRLRFRVQRRLQFLNTLLVDRLPNPQALHYVLLVLELGPFPPPALPGFSGTTNLSATPGRPACPSRASGWSSLATLRGLPCFVRFPCVHAVANTPARRLGLFLLVHPAVSAFPEMAVGSARTSSFSRCYGAAARKLHPSLMWTDGAPMQKPNDLNQSRIVLKQDSTLIAVIEMSLSSWLVAGVVPGVERQPLKKLAVDESTLLKLLNRWREEAEKAGRRIERIAVVFEAGRDGFWLARWLRARGIEAHVIHASSVAVSREHRRAKTDRLDTELLKRVFLGWLRGERDHCKMVAIPTTKDEDAKRPNRERQSLVGEQTRIVNRMKAALICWASAASIPS